MSRTGENSKCLESGENDGCVEGEPTGTKVSRNRYKKKKKSDSMEKETLMALTRLASAWQKDMHQGGVNLTHCNHFRFISEFLNCPRCAETCFHSISLPWITAII